MTMADMGVSPGYSGIPAATHFSRIAISLGDTHLLGSSGIELEHIAIPWENYRDKLITMIAGGLLGPIGVLLFPQIPWALFTWIGSLVAKFISRA